MHALIVRQEMETSDTKILDQLGEAWSPIHLLYADDALVRILGHLEPYHPLLEHQPIPVAKHNKRERYVVVGDDSPAVWIVDLRRRRGVGGYKYSECMRLDNFEDLKSALDGS